MFLQADGHESDQTVRMWFCHVAVQLFSKHVQ